MTPLYPTPGSVYKLRDGLAMDTLADPAIDQKLLKVTAVICTPAVDRQGEIIIPSGGSYENYKKNPAVLWEHGLDAQITTPIAKCETPEGQLALRASEQVIEADSYFLASDKPSSQVFNLIVERIVRATSIHVVPRSKVQKTIDGDTITLYPEWDMVEFSWGKIGINPEAVRKVLDCGKLDGCEIIPSIAKMLRPWAATRKGNGVGFDFGKAKSMTPEEEAAAKKAAEVPAETDIPAEETPAETKSEQMKPSPALLSAIGQSLSQLKANVEAGLNMIEDPEVDEFLKGDFTEGLDMLGTMVDGMLSTKGGKSKTEEPGEEPPPPDEETMKTWLAGGSSRGHVFTGFAAQLDTIAKSKGPLTPGQRREIERITSSIRKSVGESRGIAKSLKAKAAGEKETAKEGELAVQLTNVAKTFQTVTADLKTLIPAK